jgi:hypothetical protein
VSALGDCLATGERSTQQPARCGPVCPGAVGFRCVVRVALMAGFDEVAARAGATARVALLLAQVRSVPRSSCMTPAALG